MAITHKDINLLTQKATIAGTEKIPVSDTEYVTTTQIASLGGGGGGGGGVSDVTLGGSSVVSGGVAVLPAYPDITGKQDVIDSSHKLSYALVDTSSLTQKSSIAGTEKLPVSDTEYITPSQINGALETVGYPYRDSVAPIQAKGVLNYCHIVNMVSVSSEVSGYYMDTNGEAVERSVSSYRTFAVTAGKSYLVCTTFGSSGTNKTRCAAIWLDSNNAVVSYESDFMNSYGSITRYYDIPFKAPDNAVTLVVNFDPGYVLGGVVKESPLDNEVSLTSANAVENRIIRQNFLYAPLRSTTVLENTRIADNGQTSSSSYLDVVRIEVVPGNTYSVWTHMNIAAGLSSFFMFVWTDSNGAGVKAEEYYEVGSGHKYWYNHFMIAPEGAAYLNVNVWQGYLNAFLCQRLCTSSYIRKEQVQSNWNETDSNSLKYIANKPTIPTVPTISTNIATDATSDEKTTSPKAVKTYVDNICGDIETLLASI